MIDNKLITLFTYLTEEDLSEFARLVKNTAPGQGERLVVLFDYLQKKKGTFNASNLEEKRLFQYCFKGEAFDRTRLLKLFNQLHHKILDFLVSKELDADPSLRNKLLADACRRRNMSDSFIQITNKGLEDKALPDEEAEQYLAVANRKNDLYYQPKNDLRHAEKFKIYLKEGFENLLLYFLVKTLKYACEAQIRHRYYDEEAPKHMERLFELCLSCLDTQTPLLVKLFYDTYLLLSAPNVTDYDNLKRIFFEQHSLLKSEKKTLLLLLSNSLTQINYPGGRIAEHFELYKWGVKHGLFIEYNRISPVLFNNIIHIACQSQNYDWAQVFIDEHVQYLDSSKKELLENIRILFTCQLEVGKGNYEHALVLIKNIKYLDQLYTFRKYGIMLKCLYELRKIQEEEDIEKYCDSFTRQLNRKSMKGGVGVNVKKQYKNFVKILRKLLVADYKKAITKPYLLDLLNSFKGEVVDEIWLTEKINEHKK